MGYVDDKVKLELLASCKALINTQKTLELFHLELWLAVNICNFTAREVC